MGIAFLFNTIWKLIHYLIFNYIQSEELGLFDGPLGNLNKLLLMQ